MRRQLPRSGPVLASLEATARRAAGAESVAPRVDPRGTWVQSLADEPHRRRQPRHAAPPGDPRAQRDGDRGRSRVAMGLVPTRGRGIHGGGLAACYRGRPLPDGARRADRRPRVGRRARAARRRPAGADGLRRSGGDPAIPPGEGARHARDDATSAHTSGTNSSSVRSALEGIISTNGWAGRPGGGLRPSGPTTARCPRPARTATSSSCRHQPHLGWSSPPRSAASGDPATPGDRRLSGQRERSTLVTPARSSAGSPGQSPRRRGRRAAAVGRGCDRRRMRRRARRHARGPRT